MKSDTARSVNFLSYFTVHNALKAFVVINSVTQAHGVRKPARDILDTPTSLLPVSSRYAADPASWAHIAASLKPAGAPASRDASSSRNRRLGTAAGDNSGRQHAALYFRPVTKPGLMPAEGINGPAGAWEIPGLSTRKRVLRRACVNQGINASERQAWILAAALIEGDLTCNTDPDKTGLAATFGVFNLNRGMIHDLGLDHLVPAIQRVDVLSVSLDASVQVIEAALQTYGLDGFKLWQRGGQTLKNDPQGQQDRYLWASYDAAFNHTVDYLLSGTGLTDDFRYAERVPAV